MITMSWYNAYMSFLKRTQLKAKMATYRAIGKCYLCDTNFIDKNPELFKNFCNCALGGVCTERVDIASCRVHGMKAMIGQLTAEDLGIK